jgi:CRP-like cAMP-binding protein
MLDALEDVTSQTKISELPFPDADLIYFSQDVKKIKQVKAAGFMKKHPVFESVSEEALLSLAEACSLDHVQENSIILNPSVYTENVTVLVQGRAVLYGESDGGWRNPVRILKPGSFLNIGVLTGETRPRNLVMNDMEEVMVLRIPYKTFQEFLYDHPSVSLRLVSQIEREKQDYMRLWVKAL